MTMEGLKEFGKKVLPFVASPALVILFYFLLNFWVKPIAIWELEYPVGGVVFLLSIVGATVASFFPRSRANAKKKGLAIGISISLFLGLLLIYSWVSIQPPNVGWEWLWELICLVTYFGAYLALGYGLAYIVRVLIERGWISKTAKEGKEET
jgi:hypothetical protein